MRIGDPFVSVSRIAARFLGVTACVAFLIWRIEHGIPAGGEARHWEVLMQLALLVLVAVGNAVSWKWEIVGATIMAVGGLSLAVVLAFQYDPTTTVPVALLFFVPAGLHWLAWQRDHERRRVLALGALLVAMLGAAIYLAISLFDYFYGPAHPQSELAELPSSAVEWIWSGDVTPTSARVTAALDEQGDARLTVATDEAFEHRVATVPAVDAGTLAGTGEPSDVVAFELDGLEEETTYHYAVEVDGALDTIRAGRFTTFPDGPGSFTIAVGSCGRYGSNGAVFDTIRDHDPLLYLQVGDLYYADIGQNDREAFRRAFDTTLTTPAQSALYRSTPVAYTWDDHDAGPNDADSTSDALPAAQVVYREIVPHYPLPSGDGESPINQAFTVGRVRFLMMDTRSNRSPKGEPDSAAKTMLGAAQQTWLEEELLAADDQYALTVLVSSVPWIAAPSDGSDDWAGYATERREIADFMADHDLENVLMLAGDAHMIAIDDGSHSDYSTSGGGGFPVFHSGALDRPGSDKGGPFSEGTYPGPGHFGLVDVDDDGGREITVTLRGLTWEDEVVTSYEFSVDGLGPSRSG